MSTHELRLSDLIFCQLLSRLLDYGNISGSTLAQIIKSYNSWKCSEPRGCVIENINNVLQRFVLYIVSLLKIKCLSVTALMIFYILLYTRTELQCSLSTILSKFSLGQSIMNNESLSSCIIMYNIFSTVTLTKILLDKLTLRNVAII